MDASAADVVVRVPAELSFLFRPRDRRARERRLAFDPDATVAHVVRAAGVPPTEVGGLRLDGLPVAPDARTRPRSVVEVTPADRPQPVPSGGFLLDVGLGALARRLRLLGLDAAWSNSAEDAELAARAAAEDRVLLTQDRGLLMRRGVRGALVRGSRPDEQLADVLDRFSPPLAPLSRCTACGAGLVPVPKAEVADRVPPGTRRTIEEFARCPACGGIYWRGAHARRIDAMVDAATHR
ncbi:Mut7-C RNAse domain-containing protein [Geodermatophilus sp. CPCC 205761]|uniref:Mut7-C RNAse domain-containing protein n=1 Tax=Geodermatophilus sp. CPCC 205761 TaxID=2936597 RepID=UPI003EEFA577